MKSGWKMGYLAGIVDGEGCVTVMRQSRNGQPTVTVVVSMTEPAPLRLLHEEFGGGLALRVARNERCKPSWVYRCQAKKAEALLRALRPYLIVKRPQADLCLALRDSMKGEGILPRGLAVNADKAARIHAFRDGIVAQIRVLNQRGVAHAARI